MSMKKMWSRGQLSGMIPKVLEDKDVVAKTLKQKEANYLFEFEVDVDDTTNFERDGEQYCRIEEVNGEIHIIILARFKNKDTSSHSTRLATIDIANIPEHLSSKIYGVAGPLSENSAGIIRIAPMGIQAGSPSIQPCRLSGQTANTLRLYQPNGLSVSAGDYITFSMEVNLSVL